jgi:hypothetical protein
MYSKFWMESWVDQIDFGNVSAAKRVPKRRLSPAHFVFLSFDTWKYSTVGVSPVPSDVTRGSSRSLSGEKSHQSPLPPVASGTTEWRSSQYPCCAVLQLTAVIWRQLLSDATADIFTGPQMGNSVSEHFMLVSILTVSAPLLNLEDPGFDSRLGSLQTCYVRSMTVTFQILLSLLFTVVLAFEDITS